MKKIAIYITEKELKRAWGHYQFFGSVAEKGEKLLHIRVEGMPSYHDRIALQKKKNPKGRKSNQPARALGRGERIRFVR